MASIQTRNRSDGTTAYRVMFRLQGRLVGETFDDAKTANTFAQLVDRIGGEAARKLRDARDDYAGATLLHEWLEDHIARLTGVTDGTRRDYRAMARLHINPTLGDYPVEALGRRHLEEWVNTLTPTMSGKTLRNVHALLSASLDRAVYDGLIPANLAKGVRLPASDHNKTEMVTLTPNEFTTLLDSFPAHWQPFIATLAGTGMRWGEATALPCSAVDLDTTPPTVRVQQAWKRTGKSQRELGAPKTRKARRVIPISRSLAETLRPLIEGRSGAAFVFTALEGGVIHHGTFYPRVWKPALAKAGLGKRPRIHDLRHTYATWMARRVSLPVLQRLLGHESIQTTVDVYGGAMPADLMNAADAIEEALAGALPDVAEEPVQELDQIGWRESTVQDQQQAEPAAY